MYYGDFLMITGNSIRKNVFLLLVITMLILWGCTKEPEISLPFETIEKIDDPGTGINYQNMDPKLDILISGDDIAEVLEFVSFDSQVVLQELDYDQYIVVAVFQGRKGELGYGVEIQKVTRQGNRIVVHVHFTEHDPNSVSLLMESSPYHLVKLSRDGLQGDFQFVLNVDGKVKIRQDMSIP